MDNYGLTEDGRLVLERICEDGKAELGGAITGDGRIISLFMVSSGDAGAGVDAILDHIAAQFQSEVGGGQEAEVIGLTGAEVGAGVDVISALKGILDGADTGTGVDVLSALLAELSQSDTGIGVDSVLDILAELSQADTGIGMDSVLDILAELSQADSGSGIESELIWIHLLLKLLQTKNIDVTLSHEKLLNLKLSQRQKGG